MHKLYYSISEASQIADEEQHILRYWEKEFEQLKPKKNRGGNRIYSEKDIFVILTIRKLLRDQKLSIKGAKDQLKDFSFDAADNSISETLKPGLKNLDKSHSEKAIAATSVHTLTGNSFDKDVAKEIYNLLKDVLAYLKES